MLLGVLLLGGGWCWCEAAAHSARSVAVCAWGSPSSSMSCISCPVLPRKLWRVVGWVESCWTRSVGWRERCGRGVTPHQHWRRRVGRIEHHDRCLLMMVLRVVYFAHRMGSVRHSMSSSSLRGQVRSGGWGSSLHSGIEFGRSRSSNVQRTFAFFASQTLHDRNFFLKKIRRCK